MSNNSLRYHSCLGNYFSGKSLYLDEQVRKKTNNRKLVEQPWQQIKSSIYETKTDGWDLVIATLCNLYFIEAKCVAGMTFELIDDYYFAWNNFPDNQLSLLHEKESNKRVQNWIQKLIENSEKLSKRWKMANQGIAAGVPEPLFSEHLEASHVWNQEIIDTECKRIFESSTRLDKFNSFKEFVASHSYPLIRHSDQSGFILQQALRAKLSSDIQKFAEKSLTELSIQHFRWISIPPVLPNPLPALLRTIEDPGISKNGCVTSDGLFALSCGNYNLKYWDLASGRCQKNLESLISGVVSITPDGKYAVIAGSFKSKNIDRKQGVEFWDLKSGYCINRFEVLTFSFHQVSISPDGQFAFTYESLDRTELGKTLNGSPEIEIRKGLRLWRLDNGQCFRTIELPGNEDYIVCTTPELKFAITVGLTNSSSKLNSHPKQDKVLRLWNFEQGKCLKIIDPEIGAHDSISSLIISIDGQYTITVDNKFIRVWDLKTGKCQKTIQNNYVNNFKCDIRCITPDMRYALFSTGMGFKLFDLEKGECLRTYEVNIKPIDRINITPDGRYAVSWNDGVIQRWNLERGQSILTSDKHPFEVTGLKISPNGQDIVSTDKYGRELRIWNVVNRNCKIIKLEKFNIKCACLTEDGKNLIAGGGSMSNNSSSVVEILDMSNGQSLKSIEGRSYLIERICVTPDNTKVVSVCSDKILRVWNFVNNQEIWKFEGHYSPISYLSISMDSKLAFTCGGGMNYGGSGINQDCDIRVWDIIHGKCLWVLKGHTNYVSCALEVPGTRYLISGSWDHTLRIWDLRNGKSIHTMEKPSVYTVKSSIRCLSVSPDGHYAVSGGTMYGKLHLWDVENGQLVHDFIGHSGDIRSVIITPNGRYMLSAGQDRTVRVWDLNNMDCVALFYTDVPVVSLAISPSSNLVVCGITTGEIIVLETVGVDFHAQLEVNQPNTISEPVNKKWWKFN